MTTDEAKQNIGQQFKVAAFTTGILGQFDTIKEVSDDGIITGDFIEAHAEDCRLKGDQPTHLATYQQQHSSHQIINDGTDLRPGY